MELLKVENLNLSYDRNQILKNISFNVDTGEIVGIVGLSGAGKTSLLRTLNLLQKADSGKIIFDGTDLNGLTEKQVRKFRKEIGVVFQQFNLFRNKTVEINIGFPLSLERGDKKEIKEKISSLIEEVGLKHRLSAYPSQLSGGELQRVAIARALITDPKMILLDEPTSALDPMITKKVLDLVLEINKKHGITMVTVTHDMDVVKKICDKVAYLKNGELKFYGPTHEFFAKMEKDFTAESYDELLASSGNENKKENAGIYKITFWGKHTGEPIIWDTAKNRDLSLNILYGKIEALKHGPFGVMYIEISGRDKEIFVKELEKKVYGLEVIG